MSLSAQQFLFLITVSCYSVLLLISFFFFCFFFKSQYYMSYPAEWCMTVKEGLSCQCLAPQGLVVIFGCPN